METGFNPSLTLATLPIYAMIFAGWLARKAGWLTPESDRSLMRLAIDVSLPCFVFYNMLGNGKLADAGYALCAMSLGAFGICMCLFMAYLAAKALGLKTGEGKRTFVVTTGVHNYGFFIVALAAILSPGGDMIGLILTHNVGCDLVFWSAGLALISSSEKFSLKVLLKGPVIAVLVALFFIWTGLAKHIPEFAVTSAKMIGGAAIPLNLMILGTLMFDMFGCEKFNLKIVGTAVLLRAAVMPCAFVALAAALPLDMSLKKLLVYQALAPCGVTAAVLAKHFGGHPQMAVQITVATLVAALAAVPFWMWAGMSLIGA